MRRKFESAITPPDDLGEAFWFAFSRDRMLIHRDEGNARVPTRPAWDAMGIESVRQQYLGTFGGRHCFSAELPEDAEAPAGMAFKGLRSLYTRLEEDLFWVAGRAIQIVNWDRTHQFCGQCGAHTENSITERAKVCPNCGLTSFPRLAPAMIVAVEREGKILLARSRHFPPEMYSVLAGFVEPGESLEDTVHREVYEEVGIRVKDVLYFGSQPWPFPNSLMVGFTAHYASGEIRITEEEIEDAGWFAPDGFPVIPSGLSISRKLIDGFVRRRAQGKVKGS